MLYLDLLFLVLTTIIAISWISCKYMSNWVSRQVKKLSMTVRQYIISVSPEFNFKLKMKKKINNNINKYGCRKYVSAKCKGRTARIGYKSSKKMTVYEIYQTTYLCSAVSTNSADLNFQYDSDSFVIGIDNHASKIMFNNIKHFITLSTPTPNTFVKGAGGYINVMDSSTLRCRIEDDDKKVYTILIKNGLYVPNTPKCLLSYQH